MTNQTPARIRVSIKYGLYNDRRYGKPWIARVTSWPVGGRPEIEWGSYLGDDSGGECEIMASAGDIIRSGQKDHRKASGTANDWYLAQADGSCRSIDQSEARKLWDAAQVAAPEPTNVDLSGVDTAALIAELEARGLKLAE